MKIESVKTLKYHATKILTELHESKEPVRQPSAYLLDVADYEMMQSRMRILEGIARGETAVREGRTFTQKEPKKKYATQVLSARRKS
ncbi:MAG: prevent-host-death family protein [Xanthomonadales bacterium]|nr:prevent-host-death family protein [Xanthomonadales bacterium]